MNQDINIIGILFFFAGIFFFIRNIRMYLNPDSLKNYIKESPKASFWRKKIGIEKTIKLSKLIFLPLGIIVSITFIVIGFWSGIISLIK